MILEEKETIGDDVLGSYPPIVSNLTSQKANASPNTNDVWTLGESDDEIIGTPDDEYDRYMKLQIDKKGSAFQLFPNKLWLYEIVNLFVHQIDVDILQL